jgi:hypothetical protein
MNKYLHATVLSQGRPHPHSLTPQKRARRSQACTRSKTAIINELKAVLQQCEEWKACAKSAKIYEERLVRYEIIISAFVAHCKGEVPDHLERMMRKDAPDLLAPTDQMAAQQSHQVRTIQGTTTTDPSDTTANQPTGEIALAVSAPRQSKGKQRATTDSPQIEEAAMNAAARESGLYTNARMPPFTDSAELADLWSGPPPFSSDSLSSDPIQGYPAVPESSPEASGVVFGSAPGSLPLGHNFDGSLSDSAADQFNDLCAHTMDLEFDSFLTDPKDEEFMSNGDDTAGT